MCEADISEMQMDLGQLLTEQRNSASSEIDRVPTEQMLQIINAEDQKVAIAVSAAIPQLAAAVDLVAGRAQKGGRLFYIGAGTSGRLGILDASEIPTTYGAPPDLVVGVIAGGDTAIRNAVENAEDDFNGAWKDLSLFKLDKKDILLGIAASGRTPYVIGGLKSAKRHGMLTACLVCNPKSEIAKLSDHKLEAIVGPEFVTGSTRMKAGTATKLVLNMISTSLMVKLGRVKGNKMLDMRISNAKLTDRGVKMIMAELNIEETTAKKLIAQYGNVGKSVEAYNSRN